MKPACLVIFVAMTMRMLMVTATKIVLIRVTMVTMVIVCLSGTSPGLSLSARFGPVSGVRGHIAHNYSTI
jgi:hypothetical protein